MPAKYKNNASATIAASITTSDTTIVLTTGFGAYFPTLTAGFYFYATLFTASGELEIVKVTARSGDTLTVVRAQDDSTAKAFTAGDGFALRVVAASLNNFVELDSAQTITGSKTFSNPINGSLAGNAATVTNGVYTVGDQTIGGSKTFSGATTFTAAATFTTDARVRGNQSIGANEVLIYEGATNQLNVRTGAPGFYKYMSVLANGNMNIQGDFTATGNVTAYSDERLKENIQLIPGALAKVASVRGVTYTWKESGRAGIGVIAQEIQKIAPEAVLTSEDGTLSVAYGNLAGLLIEAIKELNAKVEILEAK